MFVHPLFMTQLERVPHLVLYQLVLVNYGEFASGEDAWMRREPPSGGLEAARAYYAMRQFNLPLYRSLTPAERATRLHHPERGDMCVEWILESLAGHELHHLAHFETIAGR